MSAHRRDVGLITKSNEVLIWEVGGSLTSIARPEIQTSPEAIVFHPLHDGHFFIFCHNWPDVGMSLIKSRLKNLFEPRLIGISMGSSNLS